MRVVGVAVIWFAAWAPQVAGPAWGQKPLTATDVVSLRYPEQVALSPDSTRLVYVLREADFARQRFLSHLWLIGDDQEDPRQLTTGDGREVAPSWSPDGSFIAFLSDRSSAGANASAGRIVRLWVIPADGGEASCLSAGERVVAHRWAATGDCLYYVARPSSSLASPANDPLVWPAVTPVDELWMATVPEGERRRVMALGPRVTDFDLSPDGTLVACCTEDEGTTAPWGSLHLRDLETGEVRELTTLPGPAAAPRFSPDGLSLACLTRPAPDPLCSQAELAVIDLVTGRITILTERLDLAVGDPVWARDGKSVYVTVPAGMHTYLYQVFPATRRIADVVRGNGVVSSLSVATEGQVYAYLREDSRTLPEVFVHRKGKLQKLTDFSAQLAPFSLGNQTVIRYQNEGYELEMVVVYPVGYVPGIRCPVLLFVHDGPHQRFVNTLRQELLFQVFANRGYLVAAPNPRGSAGYTEKFGQACRLDIGGGDYRDLMAAVMYLDDIGIGDFVRMGILGIGYGGYMVNWATTQTDRFRAAVAMGGIFNLLSHCTSPARAAWGKTYLGTNYWQEGKPYIERLPALYAKFIETPALLLHGIQDAEVRSQEAIDMRDALSALGKSVELVLYPREGHNLGNEPAHVVHWVERALSWFDRHVMSAQPLNEEEPRQE
ncbi:MAG: S9 family peptidase [bacterium]|jgi:dipeptidyl aminopeptidase/acylaminoacyl peptidase|nr:S9 family peptidase [candidate division KSB1 bacterium]MDH7560712.1 S9 family peptidase [bacterium]